MAKSSKKRNTPSDSRFDANLWGKSITPKKLLKEIYDYVDEFNNFDPNMFAEINFHLFEGSPKYVHLVNLCKIVQSVDLCKKCIRANTKECHLLIPYVPQEKMAISERVLNLVSDSCEFFTSDKKGYVRFPIKGHLEIHPIKSSKFSHFLAYRLYKEEGRPPTGESLTNVINVLEAVAHFEGENHQLQNRVGWLDGAIYVDLSDEANHVVRIGSDGWEILEETKTPLFQRYSHQRPNSFPEKMDESSAEALQREIFYVLDYINHDRKDDDIRLLIVITIISYFIPEIPHPVLAVFGSQGTAKSTFFKVTKSLVDPSKLGTQSFPKGIDNLVQSLFHQWFIGYDNVGDLPDWLSDYLCRAVTGEGFLKREIYTVEDDVIFTYKRCVGLNGINNAATKPDLLDRSILINLPRIKDSERISEEDFWASFHEIKPRLLGAIFTVLSEAMRIKPGIELSGLYRLADWTKWGAAITEALGIDSQRFLDAYGNNRNTQTYEAIDNSDLGTVILQFVGEVGSWAGTMTELYSELLSRAEKLNISTKSETWPKSPNVLSRKISPLEDTLQDLGVRVRKTRSNKIRTIEFDYVGEQRLSRIRGGQGSLSDYIDNDTDETVTDIVTERTHSNATTGQSDDSDASDDIITSTSLRIPKDIIKTGRGVELYKKRWKDFLSRTSEYSSDFVFALFDLEQIYDEKERAQLYRDLEDWVKDARIFEVKTRAKEGYKIAERS